VPARSKVIPAIDPGREKSVEPHLEQKVRSIGCPLAASLVNVLVRQSIGDPVYWDGDSNHGRSIERRR
jgi:hypothetical protein